MLEQSRTMIDTNKISLSSAAAQAGDGDRGRLSGARGPGRHRSNTDSPATERTGNTDSAIAGATEQSAAWGMPDNAGQALAAFRWEGFQTNSNPLARKPGKPHGTSGCARSFRIDRIGMACPTPKTGFSGQWMETSTGPGSTISEDVYSQYSVNISYPFLPSAKIFLATSCVR